MRPRARQSTTSSDVPAYTTIRGIRQVYDLSAWMYAPVRPCEIFSMAPPRSEFLHQIGLQLRSLRLSQGRTQEDVAERSGYTGKYVSEVERGLRDLPLSTLERIAAYGVDTRVDCLFGGQAGEGAHLDPVPELPRSVRQVALGLAALPERKRRQVLALVKELINLAQG